MSGNPSVAIRRHLPYEGEAELLGLPFIGELSAACRLTEGFD